MLLSRRLLLQSAVLSALAGVALTAAPALAAPPAAPRQDDLRMVHVLMVVDTNAPGIGADVATDGKNFRSRLEGNIPATRLDLTVMQGDDVSARNILRYYRDLKVQSDEAVVFYYTGHGCYTPQGHVLQASGGYLLRSQLLEEMQKKNAGLTVLLTDACSVEVQTTVQPVVLAAGRRAGTEVSPVFRNLFFQHRGLVDVTAAERGTSGWSNPSTGGFFTAALCQTLDRKPSELDADGDGFVCWEEFSRQLSDRTNAIFQDARQHAGSESPIREQASQIPLVFSLARPAAQAGRPVLPPPAGGFRLGVRVQPASGGVKVVAVTPGSPAAQLGLEAGDVVLAVNGTPVHSLDEYARLIDAAPLGKARLDIVDGRTGKTLSREVVLDRVR